MERADLRRSPRVRPGRLVRVTFLEASQESLSHTATLLDVSENGLGLSVETKVEPGTTLHIELEEHLVVGTAVYCNEQSNGTFRLGLELVNHLGAPTWETLLQKWQATRPSELVDQPLAAR